MLPVNLKVKYKVFEKTMHNLNMMIYWQVSPSSAPVRGGTIVTVSGHEMGASPESITAIKLAGIDCHLIPDGYVLSKQ